MAKSGSEEAPSPGTHQGNARFRVKVGDTLETVSRFLAVSPDDLGALNKLSRGSELKAGQDLLLPRGEWSESLAIRVESPAPQARVLSMAKVSGTAAVFENQLRIEVRDSRGAILGTANPVARSGDVGVHGPFTAEIALSGDFSAPTKATIHVFWASPKDGRHTDLVKIPVTIARG